MALTPEAANLGAALAAHPTRCMSAFSLLETSVVLDRRKGPEAVAELDASIVDLGIDIVALDAAQARVARAAYRRFGKGIHRAGLNLGDCCSYALAVGRGQPLLFKGEDFPHSDVQAATPEPLSDRSEAAVGATAGMTTDPATEHLTVGVGGGTLEVWQSPRA